MKQPSVYILASKCNGTLYLGVTTNLVRRVYEHKNDLVRGFTQKYNVKLLVYYEFLSDMNAAIKREGLLKSWKRDWKIKLIENHNPHWRDLYSDLIGC